MEINPKVSLKIYHVKHPDMNKHQFKLHNVIGKGGFGKVWKVERKKFKTMYAMKEMSKARIVQKKSVSSVLNERNLLAQLKHP